MDIRINLESIKDKLVKHTNEVHGGVSQHYTTQVEGNKTRTFCTACREVQGWEASEIRSASEQNTSIFEEKDFAYYVYTDKTRKKFFSFRVSVYGDGPAWEFITQEFIYRNGSIERVNDWIDVLRKA